MKTLILCLNLVAVACTAGQNPGDLDRSHTPSSPADAGDARDGDGPAPPRAADASDRAPDGATDSATLAPDDADGGARGDAAVPGPANDYRDVGPLQVTSSLEHFTGEICSFEVGSFTPAERRTATAVVLAPGFAIGAGLGSSRDALDRLARHIGSWGVTVHTVSLCTNGNGIDHARNGEAIAEFGEQLGVAVVYAGFSAGGLAAMIAAAQASNTAALLALDAVDANDLAAAALDAVAAPVHALAGEPSRCNADANMLTQYREREVRVLKVNMAHHFTFEGSACEGIKCALCSGGGEREAQAVRALATAFILAASDAEPSASAWWRAGSRELEELVGSGLVSDLQ